MQSFIDTSAWGPAEWGLVVAVIGVVIAILTYRLGVQQGRNAEEAQQTENERREREEARATFRQAEQIVQRFAQHEGTLTPQLARLDTDLRGLATALATLEAEVTGFRQELGTLRTAESLQFLLFARRWRQATARVCGTTKASPARTKELTRLRDELTDRCGPELGIAAYELPTIIAGLTGRSLEQFQAAYRGGSGTQHVEGITFPIAVALHCIETAGDRLCDLADEAKHPDLRASLEHIFFYAVTDYMKTLEQHLPASAPPEPAPATP